MEQRSHQSKVIGEYITIREIGAGSFAVVWKAKHKVTGQEVAIKEIGTEKLNKKLYESLASEISILKNANHPNIIKLYDIVEAPNRIYLILEYCAGGDLANYIQRHKKVGEAAARNFMQQLGSGLQVLRKNNLIHRDLKPQNLLLSTNDNNAVLKIADFGFARSLQPQGMAETLCGSPLYMAPEILQFQKYDAKADLWSVGAILYQLVFGTPPFSGINHVQLLQNILKCKVQFPQSAQLHPDCIDMCRKLLRRNPVERLSFEEFFNHPFMRPSITKPIKSASTGSTEARELSRQEECLPFLLDDEPQAPSRQRRFSMTGRLSTSPPNVFKEVEPYIPDYEETRKMTSKSRTNDGAGLYEAEGSMHAGSPRTVVDSMENIEREYVVVKPFTSQEALSLSFSASPIEMHGSKAGSPHKNFLKSQSPVSHAVAPSSSGSTPPAVSGDTPEGPSPHPATRLPSLRYCARLLAELATDKLDAGYTLESFAVQLVCLATWKEALQISHAWTATDTSEEASTACMQVEEEFSNAVDCGENIASLVKNFDANMPLPDAIESIFQAALAVGRTGAVEELMGNMSNAAVAYGKAVTFFYFLLVEAPPLQLNPPVVLTPPDRQRLKRYADMINSRLNLCTAQREQEKPGSTL